jgi:nuclear pore complex protein Nup107
MEASDGPHSWPQAVLEQQPRDLVGVFQKLHSGDLVHDNVQRSCKEQQRMVQMDLMMGDYSHLLDLLKDWTIPKENTLKPHGHPQMVRFGAHLVLVLRRILADATDEVVLEKLRLAGDLILNGYVIFLFTEHQEDLVGVYASQLAPHLCVELYVNFMDLRQNDNVAVKYRIFRSAIEFLPFFQENDEYKGCVSDILEK